MNDLSNVSFRFIQFPLKVESDVDEYWGIFDAEHTPIARCWDDDRTVADMLVACCNFVWTNRKAFFEELGPK